MSSTARDRVLLWAGSIACIALFIWLASVFGVPPHPHAQGSLLAQASPAVAMIVTLVALVACVLLSSVIVSLVHFDAGLFCAAIGLIALSVRGGPMRYVLMYSAGPHVFLTLAVELMLLFAIVGIGWAALLALRSRGLIIDDVTRDGLHEEDEAPGHHAMALAAQAVTMGIAMLLLARTDEKAQIVASVAIAAWLGTLAAHGLFPVSPSVWYWAGPMIVGLFGYVAAWFGADATWAIGQVSSHFAPLARPLPLDYAGAGTAGALLGYWTSRRWQRTREADAAAGSPVEAPPAAPLR